MSARFVLGPRAPEAPLALGDETRAEGRTWGHFTGDVAKLAAGLRARGVVTDGAPESELMVACHDRYLCAVTLVAVWSLGRCAALPPAARRDTVDALCEARGVAAVLHDGELPRSGSETTSSPSGSEAMPPPLSLDVRAWLEAAPEASTSDAAPPAPPTSWTFAPAQQLVTVYTSGSTGAHLACPKTAAQLLGEAELHVETLGLGPTARLLATVPSQHIYGLLFSVLVPLFGGGAFVRSTPQHAEAIAAAVARFDANVLCSVPVHLQGLAVDDGPALPRLARIISSGAPLPADTARGLLAKQGRPVLEVLGSSETGGLATRERGADAFTADVDVERETNPSHGQAWRPLRGVAISADEEQMMLVRSPFVSRLAAAAGDTTIPDAPYRGGDRISCLDDGRFLLLGRADGILKIGGSRVSVSEIEARLRACPGVTDAAVFPVDVTSSRGHELWAVVAGRDLTVPQLRAHLLRHVEAVAVPRRFRVVEALPREATGKLTRARLEALFEKPAARPAQTSTPPATPSSTSAALPPNELRTRLAVPASSIYFRGHFEGFPLLPGVVQLNNLALGEVRRRWPELQRLTRVQALKFKSPIRPDDEVTVEARRVQPEKVTFALRRGDELLGQGTLCFAPPEG